MSVTNDEKQKFNDIMVARSNIRNFFDANQDIPANVVGSAYELVGSSYQQKIVSDFYNKNMILGSYVSAYAGAALSLAGKIVNVNLFVTVRFSDGSSANLTITGATKEDGQYKIQFTLASATDIDGNTIPQSAAEFRHGIYNFTIGGITSLQNFVNAAAVYGVSIYNPNNITGRVYITDCDGTRDDKHGVCIAQK